MKLLRYVLALAATSRSDAFILSIRKAEFARPAVTLPFPDAPFQEKTPSEPVLPREDTWIASLDYNSFGNEVFLLGEELKQAQDESDVTHLNTVVLWRNLCAAFGLATVWMTPNPLTVAALSTWTYSSWAMIGHHVLHNGYSKVSDFNSKGFAVGSFKRRALDWFDWMKPEAWNLEHNKLHHYRLNELNDPDLVQRNVGFLRDSPVPLLLKYAVVSLIVPVWKWFFYAPNTFKELQIASWKKENSEFPDAFDQQESATVLTLLAPLQRFSGLQKVVPPLTFFASVVGPFFVARFVLLPLFLSTVFPGSGLAFNAFINLVLAEGLTNAHAFLTIVTNHCGNDLYTFRDAVKPRSPSFYVRQIVGSANYRTGGNLNDFLHGWLNYQIEHHVWPDLSMKQYQIAAPRLKAICEKHGVPYVQESVFTRLRKTVDVMVGRSTMREFPVDYEPARDKLVAADAGTVQ